MATGNGNGRNGFNGIIHHHWKNACIILETIILLAFFLADRSEDPKIAANAEAIAANAKRIEANAKADAREFADIHVSQEGIKNDVKHLFGYLEDWSTEWNKRHDNMDKKLDAIIFEMSRERRK